MSYIIALDVDSGVCIQKNPCDRQMAKIPLTRRIMSALADPRGEYKFGKVFIRFFETRIGADKDHWNFALFADDKLSLSKSDDFQDLWVLYETNSHTSGFFVEVGASDGLRKSNCWLLEEQGWQGIAIEPDPVSFETLEGVRKCKVRRVAVVPGFSLLPWRLLGRVGSGISERSTSFTQALRAPKTFLWSLCIVPAKKLSVILENCNAPRNIDYISLDTEGGEIRMFQEALETGYIFDLVSIEASTEHVREVIRYQMRKNDYEERFPGIARSDLLFRRRRCN